MGFIDSFIGFFRFFFRYVKKDFLHSLIGRKTLDDFLEKIRKNATFSILLNEIKNRNLKIEPMKSIYEACGTAMAVDNTQSTIFISIQLMRDILEGKRSVKKIQAQLAHEIGHFDNDKLENETREERKRTCQVKNDCLYMELLASRKGFKIIRKITKKEVSANIITSFTANSFAQCFECLKFLRKNATKCPKLKELKKIIKFTFKKNKKSIKINFKVL